MPVIRPKETLETLPPSARTKLSPPGAVAPRAHPRRSRLLAGVCLAMAAATGSAFAQDGAPVEAPPAGDSATPAAEGSAPASDAAAPSADGATPAGDSATPAAEAAPSADGAAPAADGAVPAVEGATPAVDGAAPGAPAVKKPGKRPARGAAGAKRKAKARARSKKAGAQGAGPAMPGIVPPADGYVVEKQEKCEVRLLVLPDAPDAAGDVLHFVDELDSAKGQGRVIRREDGPGPETHRLILILGAPTAKACPDVSRYDARRGEGRFKNAPPIPSLPSALEVSLVAGYIQENWKVAEKASGGGLSTGALVSYEFPRSGRLGALLHASAAYEALTLRNERAVIQSVDPETSVARAMLGLGAGVAYHLGANGNARIQGVLFYERSVFGSAGFKVNGVKSERDYSVPARIAPMLRYDHVLLPWFSLGAGVSWQTLRMRVQDYSKKDVAVNASAVRGEVALGVRF